MPVMTIRRIVLCTLDGRDAMPVAIRFEPNPYNRPMKETERLPITLEPLDDYVVVEPSDEETETRSGLIIPASTEAGCRSGIVTGTGPESLGVEPGDKVLF